MWKRTPPHFQAGAVSALNLAQLTIGFGLGFSATFVPFAKEYGIGSSKRINHGEIALMGTNKTGTILKRHDQLKQKDHWEKNCML